MVITQQLDYTIFKIDLGWMGILGSASGIKRLTLPQPSVRETRWQLGINDHAPQSTEQFRDLVERLRLYFSGQKVTFPDELDLSAATPFQRRVWEITRLIPRGETRSYAWVAEQIGKPEAARAVGQALGRNPLPIIIPCHRVLTSDGRLGGFSGGLEMKKQLLRLEGTTGFGQ